MQKNNTLSASQVMSKITNKQNIQSWTKNPVPGNSEFKVC